MCVVRQQDGESLSGLGSTTAATVSMKHILGRVIDHVKAELGQDTVTLLDSSCGDMNWMPRFLDTRTDVVFTGYDITVSNIDSLVALFNHLDTIKCISSITSSSPFPNINLFSGY